MSTNQNKIYSKYSRTKPEKSRKKYVWILIGVIGMALSFTWLLLIILEVIDYASGMSYADVHGYSGFLTKSLNDYLISFIICMILFFFFSWMYRNARRKY